LIWVLGGTSDSREIALFLRGLGLPVVLSVATPYGRASFSELPGVDLLEGPLGPEEMLELMASRGVRLVVDASHPYAVSASRAALEASRRAEVPYVRFERGKSSTEGLLECESFEEAARLLSKERGNVFLAVGVKNLGVLVREIGPSRVYARVLPSPDSIRRSLDLGIPPSHLVAMQGPFPRDLNASLYRMWRIEHLLTKESGDAGGFRDKVEPALEMGIRVWVVRRPRKEEALTFRSLEELADLLRSLGFTG